MVPPPENENNNNRKFCITQNGVGIFTRANKPPQLALPMSDYDISELPTVSTRRLQAIHNEIDGERSKLLPTVGTCQTDRNRVFSSYSQDAGYISQFPTEANNNYEMQYHSDCCKQFSDNIQSDLTNLKKVQNLMQMQLQSRQCNEDKQTDTCTSDEFLICKTNLSPCCDSFTTSNAQSDNNGVDVTCHIPAHTLAHPHNSVASKPSSSPIPNQISSPNMDHLCATNFNPIENHPTNCYTDNPLEYETTKTISGPTSFLDDFFNLNISDKRCCHPSHDNGFEDIVNMVPVPTDYFRLQVSNGSHCYESDVVKLNCHINDLYVGRLVDIDENANSDVDLKLVTYQEWVSMLLEVNEILITNMENFEKDVHDTVNIKEANTFTSSHVHSASDTYCCAPTNCDNELLKAKQDICTLIKIIQNGYYCDNWNLNGIQFQTLTCDQIFATKPNDRDICDAQRLQSGEDSTEKNLNYKSNKHLVMKALTVEVATKHDEVLELKKQVLSLQDEIQNAQKKIQLKENVIRDLRNDLRQTNTITTISPNGDECQTVLCGATSATTFILSNDPESRLNNKSSCTTTSDNMIESARKQLVPYSDCISQSEQSATNVVQNIKFKLEELCDANMILHQEENVKLILKLFEKEEEEKNWALKKIRFMRRNLIAMHNGDRKDFQYISQQSIENDCDANLLDAIRKRIAKMNTDHFEVNKLLHKMQIDKDEVEGKLTAQSQFSKRNESALREIADLLCELSGEQFLYTDIYNDSYIGNPFCDAIVKINNDLCEQVDAYKDEKIKYEESYESNVQQSKYSTITTVTTEDTTQRVTKTTTTVTKQE